MQLRWGSVMAAECSGVTAAWGRREGCMGAMRAAWTLRGGGSAAECSGVGAELRGVEAAWGWRGGGVEAAWGGVDAPWRRREG